MPRQARKESCTGIFHVMMRGINHQNIFEDEEDNWQFINTLDRMRLRTDDNGLPCGTNCTYYGYCLMTNHFHLLIREREEKVGETVKRIASSYVYYYNKKYGRDGHLFKERFKSEPVNDMAYFVTLLRYIHQNPVKAGIVSDIKDYDFSSWGEFTGTVDPAFQICDTATVLRRVPYEQLKDLMNEMLPEDVGCIDMENSSKVRPSDDQVWQMIIEMTGVTNSSAFQKLDMLVWSHPDYDHTYGIDAVLYNCCDEKTKVILPYDLNGEAWNKIDYNRDDKEIVEKILGLTKRKFLSHETACVPQNLYIPFENMVFNDLLGDLHADIFAISPHSARINYLLETHSEIHKNDLSIGLCIDVGNEYKYRLVFLSDIENEAIHMLYNKSYEDPVFIKIPHHTSSTSDHYLECISNLDEKPYIACTTTYKTQKLPEKDLLAGYMSQVQQVDCTGFSKNKNQNFGFIEYTYDFYKDNTITVNHEGHARIVNDDFLNSIRYHKKKNKI